MAAESTTETTKKITLSIEGEQAVIALGADGRLPVLSAAVLLELESLLDEVSTKPTLKSLVIYSASTQGFCAGADINEIKTISDPGKGAELAKRGQDIFNKIEDLPLYSVVAIHGPCVGGGCELALSANCRVALDSSRTKIGLPEIKLGILPGFGGTWRLPKLIGFPQALDIILAGKVVSVSRAYRSGLVQQLVTDDSEDPIAALLSKAKEVAASGTKFSTKTSFVDKLLTNVSFARGFAAGKAKQQVLKETRGHYPAPLKALEITMRGISRERSEALGAEARALGELAVSAESKGLVHVYEASEAAKKSGRKAKLDLSRGTVVVLGAGTMGLGIAACFLQKGLKVCLVEAAEAPRLNAAERMNSLLSKRRSLKESDKAKLLSALSIVPSTPKLDDAFLLIEAIIEDLEIKQKVLAQAATVLPNNTVIATNTSSLSVSEIATAIPSPERVAGMHFFNPAEKMPLVEIVCGEATSEQALDLLAAATVKLGKFPVPAEDVPGFLVNRCLSPYIAEAGQMLSEGYSIEEIDKAALGFGMPMGPFRMLDEVGLDVAAKVQEVITEAYGERMTAPDFPAKLVAAGRKGRKSAAGFYRFEGKKAIFDQNVYGLLGLSAASKTSSSKELGERLMLPLVLECIRCLDEGVAGEPGREAATRVDLASVMGIGFAPFRGGAICYAESIGSAKLLESLAPLREAYGERFAANEGLRKRSETNQSFYASN